MSQRKATKSRKSLVGITTIVQDVVSQYVIDAVESSHDFALTTTLSEVETNLLHLAVYIDEGELEESSSIYLQFSPTFELYTNEAPGNAVRITVKQGADAGNYLLDQMERLGVNVSERDMLVHVQVTGNQMTLSV